MVESLWPVRDHWQAQGFAKCIHYAAETAEQHDILQSLTKRNSLLLQTFWEI